MQKEGYNKKDGSKKGRKQGGCGHNRTDNCRHPNIRKK
jgi:hypothetical protein